LVPWTNYSLVVASRSPGVQLKGIMFVLSLTDCFHGPW